MPAISAVSKPTPSRTAHEFTIDDVEYLSHAGSPLLLRLFKPRGARDGMTGTSSGAHLPMLAAMRPRDKRYAATPLASHPGFDATVAAVVMVWPVIDPLRRFHHAKRLQAAGGKYPEQIDRVIPSHTKFWGTEDAMEEGNPVGILDRGETVEMPPV